MSDSVSAPKSDLLITAGPFKFQARFETALAPRTCAIFKRLLPYTERVIHVRWSGEAVWIPLGNTDMGVPAENQPLLNTGMTRDGLFLIENGEITGPVQNFRWNMSPIVGYNNMDLVGKPVPMHTGESYDGGGTALVPPVRINDFYMTSVSPAV